MALPTSDDEVVIRVILDTKQANAAMKELTDQFSSVGLSTSKLQKTIQQMSASSGSSIRDIAQELKVMYAAQVDNSGVSKQLGTNLKTAFGQQTDQAVKNLERGLNKSTNTAKGFNNVLKLIRGTLVAIGVFRVFSFIEDSLRKATAAAQDLETSLYRLRNVEKILSQSGVDVTYRNLTDAVKELKQQFPIFSSTDLTKQVSLIGIMTKDLGLSSDQILHLAQAIGVLNIRSADTEDLMTTTNKVLQSIVSKGAGVGNLGVKFSEAAVTAKAIELGYLKAGQSLSDLSDKQRDFVVGQAKVAITIENTAGELETVNDYLDTNAAKIEANKQAWIDLLAVIGQGINNLIPNLIPALEKLQKSIEVGRVRKLLIESIKQERNQEPLLKRILLGNFPTVESLGNSLKLQSILNKLFTGAKLTEKEYALLKTQLESLPTDKIQELFPDPSLIKDRFTRELVESLIPAIDTATESAGGLTAEFEKLTELQGFDSFIKNIENLQQKIQDAQDEFNTNTARDEYDFYSVKLPRIQEDYAIKKEKVTLDANQAIADANRKNHEREVNEEAKFQEQMRQLREKFLFNLEDALRERDARQVLRLQRQYEMDKTAATNEYELRQQQQDQQHADDIARIKRERDERLAELDKEEQLKIERETADFELDQARKKEDHDRDMEQLRAQLDERLQEYATKLAEENNLRAGAADEIYKILQSYYGPGGQFDRLYSYSYQSAVNTAQGILDAVNGILAQSLTSSLSNPLKSSYNVQAIQSIGSQAEGGTYFANKPTHALFGDVPGGEIASFIPMRKLQTASQGSPSAGGGNGMGGQILLRVDLSPDLEARIVDKSLDNVSAVIRTVRNER